MKLEATLKIKIKGGDTLKKKTKRRITMIMALIMIFMTFAQLSFAEEESNNAKIRKLVENGYIQGYSDGSLGLERNITS